MIQDINPIHDNAMQHFYGVRPNAPRNIFREVYRKSIASNYSDCEIFVHSSERFFGFPENIPPPSIVLVADLYHVMKHIEKAVGRSTLSLPEENTEMMLERIRKVLREKP